MFHRWKCIIYYYWAVHHMFTRKPYPEFQSFANFFWYFHDSKNKSGPKHLAQTNPWSFGLNDYCMSSMQCKASKFKLSLHLLILNFGKLKSLVQRVIGFLEKERKFEAILTSFSRDFSYWAFYFGAHCGTSTINFIHTELK